uniref:Uncharacterized protein n=1 Tax=Helianthus annuus TaxID=4232 RepID=A0A251U3Z7_HELAN
MCFDDPINFTPTVYKYVKRISGRRLFCAMHDFNSKKILRACSTLLVLHSVSSKRFIDSVFFSNPNLPNSSNIITASSHFPAPQSLLMTFAILPIVTR